MFGAANSTYRSGVKATASTADTSNNKAGNEVGKAAENQAKNQVENKGENGTEDQTEKESKKEGENEGENEAAENKKKGKEKEKREGEKEDEDKAEDKIEDKNQGEAANSASRPSWYYHLEGHMASTYLSSPWRNQPEHPQQQQQERRLQQPGRRPPRYRALSTQLSIFVDDGRTWTHNWAGWHPGMIRPGHGFRPFAAVRHAPQWETRNAGRRVFTLCFGMQPPTAGARGCGLEWLPTLAEINAGVRCPACRMAWRPMLFWNCHTCGLLFRCELGGGAGCAGCGGINHCVV